MHGRCGAIGLAHNHSYRRTRKIHVGELLAGVVGEVRRYLLFAFGQRNPGLDAVESGVLIEVGAGALGVHDSTARRHQVDRTRGDRLHDAQAVAMNDLTGEKVGDRGQTDMRVRTHGDTLAGREFRRPHMIEKYERTHHATGLGREYPSHCEFAEVRLPRRYPEGDRPLACGAVGFVGLCV